MLLLLLPPKTPPKHDAAKINNTARNTAVQLLLQLQLSSYCCQLLLLHRPTAHCAGQTPVRNSHNTNTETNKNKGPHNSPNALPT